MTLRGTLFAAFTLSGFSGLIYESIWTHYLKLFLGHSAYAQTLVLGIFMGGMAAGAAIAARRSRRWDNPLRAYAVCEALLGLLALGFHPAFNAFIDLAYDTFIPALGSPDAVLAFKWLASAALILPQSILLGLTFPLMSAGILRRFPDAPGASLATLYFTNSIGGAAGVLMSGFVLVDRIGLPGTIGVAGAINLLLAGWVWVIARGPGAAAAPASDAAAPQTAPGAARGFATLMVATAFITGLSSLVYEVGWIRMLSLVLGSSTHAFELMLSAFIAGLAFGGLWIRRRIDRMRSPVFALACVQVLMGVLALATLPLYGYTFDAMADLMAALEKTDRGYLLFNLGSHAIAFAIMLPATFCAGMTLPLATLALLSRGGRESAIGTIYSANTLGAIAGVVVAVHLGLPWLGLRDTIIAAAATDLALGVMLMAVAESSRGWLRAATSAGIAALAVGATAATIRFDPQKLASGVYRTGDLAAAGARTVIASRDGKTATIALVESKGGSVAIMTNGKSDATINLASSSTPGPDEPTMLLAGAIGGLLRPETRAIANIGFGSGLTTHTALGFPGVERIDSIEIEPRMIELARGFYPRNARAYEDARSHFHIDDAKSYFSTQGRRYDVIVSEPSNPWVSGVAGLFSAEWYRLVPRYLKPEGLLVQWLQLYEIDFPLVASMLKALDAVFEDYAIVATNNSDILVVASPQGRLPALPTALPELPAVREALERAGVRSAADLGLRVVATRKLLHPLLARESIPVNSDYYPIVDQRAARSRFLRSHATALVRISRDPVPVLAMIGGSDALRGGHAETYPHFAISQIKTAAARFAASPSEWLAEPSGQTAEAGTELAAAARACVAARTPAAALAAIVRIAYGVLAWLTPEEVERVLAWIAAQPCGMQQHGEAASYLRLFRAIAARDANAMVETSQAILSSPLSASDDAAWLVAGSALTGYLALNRPADARKLVLAHRARFAEMAGRHLLVQIALAHAGLLIDSRPAAPSKAERAHREAFAANQGCQEPSPLVLANGSGHRRITMPAQAIGKGS